MPGRLGLPRPKRLRRADIAAAGVVLLFLASICVVGAGIFIENELKPTDGRLGVPQYLFFPFCGRSYMLSDAPPYTTITRIDADIAPGFKPFVLEPTIGQIPLVDLLTGCPMNQDGFYATGIWLHVGGDEYASYSLEGGP